MCKLSIIIPIYNKSKYLGNILDSIKRQEFKDFECILVDDGSTDGSKLICDNYSENDDRFITIHKPNSGVSDARNVGLKKSKGKYITFIDADDSIESDYLLKLVRDIEQNSVDIAIVTIKKIWENNSKVEYINTSLNGKYNFKKIMPNFAKIQLSTGIFGFSCGKILRRDLIGNYLFDTSITLAEDFDFYLKLYPKVKTIYFDNDCFYGYLQESENNSTKEDDKIDYFTQLKINLRYRDFLKRMNGYNGNNKKIIDSRITSYVYFIIFHSNRNEIDIKIKQLFDLIDKNDIIININNNLMQNLILFLIKRKKSNLIKAILQSYDVLRNLKKLV